MKRYKEQDPAKVADYLQEISEIPKDKIAYIDETGIDTYLYREHCYSEKGKKVIGYVHGKKYRRVGVVAAKVAGKILAPLQYDGTMNSQLFEIWFETRLMCELPSKSTIVMDNAAFHRKKQLVIVARKYGHSIVFLPPYSPELNPIENFWAWLKNRLRKIISGFPTFDLALSDCFNVV